MSSDRKKIKKKFNYMGAIFPYKGRKGFSAMWMQQEKGQSSMGGLLRVTILVHFKWAAFFLLLEL